MRFHYIILTLCGIASAIPTASGPQRESPYLEVFKYEQYNPPTPTSETESPPQSSTSGSLFSSSEVNLEPETNSEFSIPTFSLSSSSSPPSSSPSSPPSSPPSSLPSSPSSSTPSSISTTTSLPVRLSTETTTTFASTTTTKPPTTTTNSPSYSTIEMNDTSDSSIDNVVEESSESLIYTLKNDDSSSRAAKIHPHFKHHFKHHKVEVFDYRCPKQHQIHPCNCYELDKRLENEEEEEEGSGDDTSANATLILESEPQAEHIETVAICKNIGNIQVLREAVRGFRGHRLDNFVLDGCKLPPFPNNLFYGIHIAWMEIMNSTMQFHDNFWASNCKSSCT